MSNPWLRIPLADYESHMALAGQERMLADKLVSLVAQRSPKSLAVIGCAGGNGLDRIGPGTVKRIVAVDINADYVAETNRRHAQRLGCLELYCGDVQSPALFFEPVDLLYAALIFEYVNVPAALATLRRNCRPGSVLAVVLQLPYEGPHEEKNAISPSPFTSLQTLAPLMKLVEPAELEGLASNVGFELAQSETMALASGKRFSLQVFRLPTD